MKFLRILLLLVSVSLSAQNWQQYRVKKGESLKDIAKKFSVSYKTLKKANPKISRRPKRNTVVKVPIPNFKAPQHPIDPRSKNPKDYFKIRSTRSKAYEIHKVKSKETLYSLSKKYGVSVSQFIRTNPVLAVDGLKVGQELKIPLEQKLSKAKKKYLFKHQVQSKETLYGISKLYGLEVDDLKRANSNTLANGLKVGMLLSLPKPDKKEEIERDTNQHKIEQGETLYSIAKYYGVGVSELLRENTGVVVDSLKVGSVLNLPAGVDKNYAQSNKTGVSSHEESLILGANKKTVSFQDTEYFKDSIVDDTSINVTIMLPFNFKKNSNLSKEILFANPKGLPSIVSNFYLGAEMAIDSLKQQGIKVKVTVFDTEASLSTIQKKKTLIKESNPGLIVGPLYTSNANYVATNFSSIPVYYPIYSPKQKKITAKNSIKTATEKSLFKKEVLAFVKENRKEQHLIIAGTKAHKKELEELKKNLIAKDSLGNEVVGDVSILLSDGYISVDNFSNAVQTKQSNWILIAENNNIVADGVFNGVKTLTKDTAVRIISFEKLEFHTQDLPYSVLAKYQYTYATDKVEYPKLINTSFQQAYLYKNNSYPNEYAIKGFNVTYDAVLRTLKKHSHDVYDVSYRHQQAFSYKYQGVPSNQNQAVFVNVIENVPKKGISIVRLR